MKREGTFAVKSGLAEMLKGGVIMDVVTAEHARGAESATAASWFSRWTTSGSSEWMIAQPPALSTIAAFSSIASNTSIL